MARVELSKIINALRQPSGVQDRRLGIALFGKALRRGDRFNEVWVGAGGATGLANLMAEFSVHDVRLICTKLGRTAAAIKARSERRAALGELVRLLHQQDAVDQRPLYAHYQHIIPACAPELVKEWSQKRNVEWTKNQEKRLFYGHRDLKEQNFLDHIFSPDKHHFQFAPHKTLFRWNLAFSERIFTHLLAQQGDIRIPDDFMKQFAMPLLQRLRRRRYSEATRAKFLSLVMTSLQKHPTALGSQLSISDGGLIHYVIERWIKLPETDKGQEKEYLIQLLQLLPASRRYSLRSIHDSIMLHKKLDPEGRYELLRLSLRHMKAYAVDIEDDSQEGLDRLKDMPVKDVSRDMWTGKMFLDMDNKKARQLFERLSKVHPSGDFLYADNSREKTILSQTLRPTVSRRGDAEIVRYLLMSKSKRSKNDSSDWLSRVRALVNERRQKSQQCREPEDRAFWAKSALYLCVAAGDIETLRETILWARRFNMDARTVELLYDKGTFKAKELRDLLSVIPSKDDAKPATIPAPSVRDDIQLSNQILIDLHETAAMILQEPWGPQADWDDVLRLPKAIVDRRCENALVLRGTEIEMTEVVWKPTLEVLVQVEALLSKSSSGSLSDRHAVIATSGADVLRRIPDASPSLLAGLAGFFLDTMHSLLGPERMRSKTGTVVEVIARIARSDDPTKACPFICDLILNSDDTGSWHRHILTTSFLHSLPANLAREFIYTMADAMRDSMKQQNTPPASAKNNDAPSNPRRLPTIKVTTIKMMARLLQNNKFLDPTSSCNILINLLAEARHIDTRITLVGSLISTMQRPTCSPELQNSILDALREHIVPVAAQLNERHHLSEADWEAATEPDAKLPEIGEENSLLPILIEFVDGPHLTSNNKRRVAEFVMEALEQSAANNHRWMNLFMQKTGLSLDTDELLPFVPVSFGSHSMIELAPLRKYMPGSFITMLRDFVLANVDPCPGIARVTKMVKTNRELINSNAGTHWLGQFDNPGTKSFGLGVTLVASWLQSPVEKATSKLAGVNGATKTMLQDFIFEVAKRFLINGDTQAMEGLIRRLCIDRFDSLESWKAWQAHCVSLANSIIDQIEEARAGKGSILEYGRIPSVLPNTMRLRTQILPIPYSTEKVAPLSSDVDSFISALSNFVDLLAARPLPYHDDFCFLKNKIVETPKKKDLASYALKLMMTNTSSDRPLLADYLRVELAGAFLLEATNPNDEILVPNARRIVTNWKESKFEAISNLGSSTEVALKRKGKGHWFNAGQTASVPETSVIEKTRHELSECIRSVTTHPTFLGK